MKPPKEATKQVHQIDLTDTTYSTLADYGEVSVSVRDAAVS